MSSLGQSGKISELFTGNTLFFSIPRYQRKYVWEEKNWKQLIEDIKFSIETPNWDHFIGTFVFQINTNDASNNEAIIIDGQQRIVTLQILFMAITARFISLQPESSEQEFKTKNTIDILKDIVLRKTTDSRERGRVIIDYDPLFKKIYQYVFDTRDVQGILDMEIESKILKCFKYYYNYFDENNYDFDNLTILYEKIYNIKYVVFESSSEEHAYSIFETLNARGIQLKQMELVKNYLFHHLLHDKNAFDQYKEKWSEMEEKLFHDKIDCDDYLFTLFKCYFKVSKSTVEKLYDEIKLRLKSNQEAIKLFFSALIENAPLYLDVVNANGDDSTFRFYLNYFKIKGNKQFHGVLLSLCNKMKHSIINSNQLSTYVKQLRDFLLLYNLRKIPANKIEGDLYVLAYELFHAECNREVKNAVYKFLLKDRSFYNLEDVEEAIASIRYSNRKRFSVKTSGEIVYLFEIIYANMYEDYDYIQDYSIWTIEHVLNDCEEDSIVTQLGNLLLITKALNGTVGSKEYSEKRKHYLKSSFKWIHEFAEKFKNEPTEKQIERRTKITAQDLSRLISFNIDQMRLELKKSEIVKRYLDNLKKDFPERFEVVKLLSSDGVAKALENKYQDSTLSDELSNIEANKSSIPCCV